MTCAVRTAHVAWQATRTYCHKHFLIGREHIHVHYGSVLRALLVCVLGGCTYVRVRVTSRTPMFRPKHKYTCTKWYVHIRTYTVDALDYLPSAEVLSV